MNLNQAKLSFAAHVVLFPSSVIADSDQFYHSMHITKYKHTKTEVQQGALVN
jgi:hypothetical protein